MSFVYVANTSLIEEKEESALRKYGVIIDGIKPAGNQMISLVAYRLSKPISKTTKGMRRELINRIDKALGEVFKVNDPNPTFRNHVGKELKKTELFRELVLQYSDPKQAKKILHEVSFSDL